MSEVNDEVKTALAEQAKAFESEKAKMQAKLDELLTEAKDAKRKAKDEADARAREADEAARKNGNVEALEKSWQDKLAKREKELQDKIDALDGQVRHITVNATANALANELALQGSASVLLPHIERRLTLDQRDGKPTVVVLDKDGKPSAATVEDLKKEITGDQAFAPLIVGSKATGGGASGGGKGGGAAPKSVNRSTFNGMSPEAQMAHTRDNGIVTD